MNPEDPVRRVQHAIDSFLSYVETAKREARAKDPDSPLPTLIDELVQRAFIRIGEEQEKIFANKEQPGEEGE